MMGRAIWKGNIRFGGIDVPVKLHAAVKEERIQFHLLHRRDHVKLQQQMVCAHEKVPVPAEEQTRGFELTEGKYLLIDPDELELTEPEGSRAREGEGTGAGGGPRDRRGGGRGPRRPDRGPGIRTGNWSGVFRR